MSMRISSTAFLALAACGQAPQTPQQSVMPTPAASPHMLLCAQGRALLRPVCTAERTRDGDGWVVTVRHPDGHFRRLRVAGDGTGIAAADGAERATVTDLQGEVVDVAIGDDRYRFPQP